MQEQKREIKKRKKIDRLSFVEGYTPSTSEMILNELVDAVNLLLEDRKRNYRYTEEWDRVRGIMKSLIVEGKDINKMTLRKLAKEIGVGHPQQAKNFRIRFNLINKGNEKE